MRKTIGTLLGFTLGLVLGFTTLLVSPAGATPPECTTITAEIANRPDSGLSGDWALDTFTRVAEVCESYGTFTVTGVDSGMFVTTGPTSPGDQAVPLDADIEGTITGEWVATVEADDLDDSFNPNTNEFSTSEWVKKLFTGLESSTLDEWSWTYRTWCGDEAQETWVNALSGNSGDITSAPQCPTPSPTPTATASPTPGATESPDASPSASPSPAAAELPLTGSSLPLFAGGAAVLIGLGTGLVLLGRRRRVPTEE